MCAAIGHVRFTPNSDRKSGHFLAALFNLEWIWLHEREWLRDSRSPVE
jgi:hypothetical protein